MRVLTEQDVTEARRQYEDARAQRERVEADIASREDALLAATRAAIAIGRALAEENIALRAQLGSIGKEWQLRHRDALRSWLDFGVQMQSEMSARGEDRGGYFAQGGWCYEQTKRLMALGDAIWGDTR